MPVPVSATVIRTVPASPSRVGRPLTAIASVPPSGIASRALTARFTSTCSSCARSTRTGTSSGRTVSRSAMRSLSVRSQQALEIAHQHADVDDSGLTTSRRLNISSWRVSAAARSAARPISSTSSRTTWSSGAIGCGEADAGQDHREQVVEVVRDAARELADALHPLRLRQAMLQLDALVGLRRRSVRSVATVRRRRSRPRRRAAGTSRRTARARANSSPAETVVISSKQLAGGEHLVVELVVARVGVGCAHLAPVRPSACSADPVELLPAAVDQQVALLEVLDADERRRAVDDRLQTCLARRRSASARRRSVTSTSWQRKYSGALAVAVHERRVHERVDDPPVGVHVAALHREGPAAAREQLAHQRASRSRSSGWLSSFRRVARRSCSVRPSMRQIARFRRSQRPSRSISAMPIGVYLQVDLLLLHHRHSYHH